MLIPAYRQLIRRAKSEKKQVTTWPPGAISALQDCFEHTDWDMFREAATSDDSINLEEYTDSVTGYISKCIEDVTVSKTITSRPNQKPWMTAEVRALLRSRDKAFKSGDRAGLRTARAKLSRGIREAKRTYAKKIPAHFQDTTDTRRMWQGIQTITNYKSPSPACNSDASLPDALNSFYARFEAQNYKTARKTTPPPNDQVLCLSSVDVRKTLLRVNPRKAPGPDSIPGRVLRGCAEQLTDVLTDIFNISLSTAIVPTCFKTTTIVPVPKKSQVSCLNDYRPIALTPIIMKCFEKLVMRHIKNQLPSSLDPLQFAYRPNRSTDDAISTALHLALTHLDNKDCYVRMLFIDFSSAFNTIIPQQLIGKLSLLGLNSSLCNWVLDFLTERPQSVRIGKNTSSTTILSTGAPQGCVLSPLLFTLLTHDCTATYSSNHIIKFADDTTVVGLISKNDESAYREEVQWLTDWCRTNNLSLNVDKTKEMVVDFRRAPGVHHPLNINGSAVEIVDNTEFLGVHIAENLTWSLKTSSITKKAQQRLYFLRRLRKAHLPPPILTMFYRGTVESILSTCITVWFGNCNTSDRKTLQRIVRTAEKIIGVSLPSITEIYTTRCIRKATSIVDDPTHPSHGLFALMPSGRRYRSIRASTTRLCNSFIHQAVRLLNAQRHN
uniref:Reverse transcriptase domain-containing protein n=1 Tax=Astyanax mexicanus TaxID=7994 RepID=A0A3B1K914_ASTMX